MILMSGKRLELVHIGTQTIGIIRMKKFEFGVAVVSTSPPPPEFDLAITPRAIVCGTIGLGVYSCTTTHKRLAQAEIENS